MLTLVGIEWSSPSAALTGTLVSGAGFGAAFSGSLRSLAPLALPHERAGLMAGFFVASYLAFSVPPIVAGLFTSRAGIEVTAVGYGLAVASLALTAFVATSFHVSSYQR
ncbi:hypothetical protein [Variovorax sp. YR216]|uniref:hypothetical protein n=1 Tax=Variovorax sp. YR216 TaxID=1882828 RepID=UPI000A919A72|nr:hypothetical protein [Variovorax sp. YR216]